MSTLSKSQPLGCLFGLNQSLNTLESAKPKHQLRNYDSEGRCLTLEYADFYLVNVYVPNSGMKLERLSQRTGCWDKQLREYISKLDALKPVILVGDMNVAHQLIDIYADKFDNTASGMNEKERSAFQ